jgi:hypothetical protein
MSSKNWARLRQPNTPDTVIDIVLELDKLAARVTEVAQHNAADPKKVTPELYVTRSIFMIAAALEKIALVLGEHPGMVFKDGHNGESGKPPEGSSEGPPDVGN